MIKLSLTKQFPVYSTFKHPAEVGNRDVVDNSFNWSVFRLLTPKLGFGVGWISRNWGGAQRSGFDITSVDLKAEVYRNDLHEILVSAGTTWVSDTLAPRELPPMHRT